MVAINRWYDDEQKRKDADLAFCRGSQWTPKQVLEIKSKLRQSLLDQAVRNVYPMQDRKRRKEFYNQVGYCVFPNCLEVGLLRDIRSEFKRLSGEA